MGFFDFVSQRTNTIDIWKDNNTDLMWQLDINTRLMTWYEANEYADNMNAAQYGGYTDWRLPTIEELEIVYAYKNLDIAWKYKEKGISADFSRAFYWSSTSLGDRIEKILNLNSVSRHDMKNKAWNICITNALAGYNDKSDKHCVRMVRGVISLQNEITYIEQDDTFSPTELIVLLEKKGVSFIEEGAENGNLQCQVLLYTLYGSHLDTKENVDKFKYYTKLAACQNDSMAQANQAQLIYKSIKELKPETLKKNGNNLPIDSLLDIQKKLIESIYWYKKSYDNGNKEVITNIQDIEITILKDWVEPLVKKHFGNQL